MQAASSTIITSMIRGNPGGPASAVFGIEGRCISMIVPRCARSMLGQTHLCALRSPFEENRAIPPDSVGGMEGRLCASVSTYRRAALERVRSAGSSRTSRGALANKVVE